jgi:predicted phosphodiesterase
MDQVQAAVVDQYIAAHWLEMNDREIADELKLEKEVVQRHRLGLGLLRTDQARLREVTPDKLLAVLARTRGKVSVVELADRFGVAPRVIQALIDALRAEKNVLVDIVGDRPQLASSIPTAEKPFRIDLAKHPEETMIFGVIGDTHLGSKYERLDVLEALFDRFAAEGVQRVYLAGNMIDGEAKFNRYDIYVHGVEGQVANFVAKFPQREGIETHFVTGDDHEGWYIQREHVNVGQVIVDRARAAGRSDLVYLGHIEHDVEFEQADGGSAVLRIVHGGGGSAYAISYKAQKYVETLQGGEKPKIVVLGHYHKYDVGYPREVHVIQPGCTQDQTPFLRKLQIQAMVGGCIMWVRRNDLGIFTGVRVEWFPFYDRKFYTYHW